MFAVIPVLRFRILLAFGFIAVWSYSASPFASAQDHNSSEWTWMAGSNKNTEPPGVYGQLSAPAPGNTPGGRASAISWTDANGNLWLYGSDVGGYDGNGVNGYLDDVWEYSVTIQ